MAKQEAPYTIRVGRGIKAKVSTDVSVTETVGELAEARAY